MIETSLYQYLAAYAGLTALVGDRIHPMVAPGGTAQPNIVYIKIGNDRLFHLKGYAGLQVSHIQISCFAKLYETSGSEVGVKQVAVQVLAAMEAWAGSSGVLAVYPAGDRDLYEQDREIYHVPLDFMIWNTL